jgi:hypothetical protein
MTRDAFERVMGPAEETLGRGLQEYRRANEERAKAAEEAAAEAAAAGRAPPAPAQGSTAAGAAAKQDRRAAAAAEEGLEEGEGVQSGASALRSHALSLLVGPPARGEAAPQLAARTRAAPGGRLSPRHLRTIPEHPDADHSAHSR